MPSFKYVWDDFSGGYYLGQLDNKQPKSMFTGYNVAVANDDGAAVPAYPIYKQNFTASGSPSWINNKGNIVIGTSLRNAYCSAPVSYGGRVFFATMQGNATAGQDCYVYATSPVLLGVPHVTVYRSAVLNIAGIPNAGTPICTDPICVQFSTTEVDVYVAYYGNSVYRYRFNLATNTWAAVATITTSVPAGRRIIDLTLWNSRMIATVFESDTLYYSDVPTASVYSTWSSLNFIAPGSNTDSIYYVVPRGDDLYVFKPSGVLVMSGVLGASSYIRKYKNNSNPGYIWLHCLTEHDGQIYYISRDVENTGFPTIPAWGGSASQTYNINQVIGGNEIAGYYNFGMQNPGSINVISTVTYPSTWGTAFPSIVTTANNALVCCFQPQKPSPDYLTATPSFVVLFQKMGVWARRLFSVLSANNTDRYRYVAAKTNSYVDEFSYVGTDAFSLSAITVFQYSNALGSNTVEISMGSFSATQSAAGSYFDNTNGTFSVGKLITSQMATEKPSKINRVYIEAEYNMALDDLIAQYSPTTNSPYMNVRVNNLAVDDMSFNPSISYTSTTMQYNAGTVSSLGATTSSTRVLRFDPNDTGYGYKHNIEIDFAGLRIKNIWVEGETR